MFSVDANLRLKNPIMKTLMENFSLLNFIFSPVPTGLEGKGGKRGEGERERVRGIGEQEKEGWVA